MSTTKICNTVHFCHRLSKILGPPLEVSRMISIHFNRTLIIRTYDGFYCSCLGSMCRQGSCNRANSRSNDKPFEATSTDSTTSYLGFNLVFVAAPAAARIAVHSLLVGIICLFAGPHALSGQLVSFMYLLPPFFPMICCPPFIFA